MLKESFNLLVSLIIIFLFLLAPIKSFAQPTIDLICHSDSIFCVKGEDCWTSVMVERPEASTVCANGDELEYFIDGTFGFGEMPEEGILFDFVEPSIYAISFMVINQCEDTVFCNYSIEVLDCAPPIPVCVTGLIAALSEEEPSTVAIGAEDINADSYDACSEELQFSFSADLNDVVVEFGENDIGLQALQLWVTDANGNQAFCETEVDIQYEINSSGEIWDEEPISLYPNLLKPGEILNLECVTDVRTNGNWQLINLAGQVVRRENLNTQGGLCSNKIEMSYPSGLYFLQLNLEHYGQKTFKIIIQ